jgi:hypothetical protein
LRHDNCPASAKLIVAELLQLDAGPRRQDLFEPRWRLLDGLPRRHGRLDQNILRGTLVGKSAVPIQATAQSLLKLLLEVGKIAKTGDLLRLAGSKQQKGEHNNKNARQRKRYSAPGHAPAASEKFLAHYSRPQVRSRGAFSMVPSIRKEKKNSLAIA